LGGEGREADMWGGEDRGGEGNSKSEIRNSKKSAFLVSMTWREDELK
jgi:hypothetical protein